MRIIIIEDEKPAAERLMDLLDQTSRKFELIKRIATVREAIDELPVLEADLIFLDIHLADDICFKIFEKISISTPVIFTTAYDQYAIKAFELNSIDYLLKPISPQKLDSALNKLDQLSNTVFNKNNQILEMIKQFSGKTDYKKRFLTDIGKKIKTINTPDIAWFFSEDKNTFMTTFGNRHYPVGYSLDKLELAVDPALFYRVNRKYIVNIEAIKNIFHLSGSKIKIELQPKTDDDVLVSIRRIKNFKDWLES